MVIGKFLHFIPAAAKVAVEQVDKTPRKVAITTNGFGNHGVRVFKVFHGIPFGLVVSGIKTISRWWDSSFFGGGYANSQNSRHGGE